MSKRTNLIAIAVLIILISSIFVLKNVSEKKSISNLCKSVLRNGLADRNDNARILTTFLLGEIGNKFALKYLELVLNDSNAEVRARAAEALGKIGEKSALTSLYIAIKDSDPGVRANVIDAIGKIADKSSLELITSALNDPSEVVEVAAAEAMLKLGETAALKYLVSAALQNQDPYSRRWACDALSRLGDKSVLDNLKFIAQNDSDLLVKIWAARAIIKLDKEDLSNSKHMYLSMIKNAIDNQDSGVRMRAIWALGDLEDRSSLEYIRNALRDPVIGVKYWAIEALGKLDDIAFLKSNLNDKDPYIRILVAGILSKFNDKTAFNILKSTVLNERNSIFLRIYAARAILSLQDKI